MSWFTDATGRVTGDQQTLASLLSAVGELRLTASVRMTTGGTRRFTAPPGTHQGCRLTCCRRPPPWYQPE
jgi:hypothetical protein